MRSFKEQRHSTGKQQGPPHLLAPGEFGTKDAARAERARDANESQRRECRDEAAPPLVFGSLATLCALPLAWSGRGWKAGLLPALVLIVFDLARAGSLWLQYAQLF